MKFGGILFLFLICAAISPVAAQVRGEPFHTFEFDPPAGRYEPDNDIVGERLKAGAAILGKVVLVRCENTEKFGAGFRLRVRDVAKKNLFYAGFVCDPQTGEMTANTKVYKKLQSGEWEKVKEGQKMPIGRKNEIVEFTVELRGKILFGSYGDYSFQRALDFEPITIEYYGYGAKGMAQFWEEYLQLSYLEYQIN